MEGVNTLSNQVFSNPGEGRLSEFKKDREALPSSDLGKKRSSSPESVDDIAYHGSNPEY